MAFVKVRYLYHYQDNDTFVVIKFVSFFFKFVFQLGAVMVVIVWYLAFQLPLQSVPLTTKVVSSNPVHGEVNSIQHYVIKVVSNLRQIGSFLQVLWFPPLIKVTSTI